MSDDSDSIRLIFPALGSFYEKLAQPLTWLALRVLVGGVLVYEGWSKIQSPMAMTGFVESIGFYPGVFWSPLLAALQFFGGIAIVLGLLTRPVALANAIMLAVTCWFHATHPYGDVFLTQAGIEALAADGQTLFTPEGARSLANGGTRFLHQVQDKAVFFSAIWAMAMLLFAGYGGGVYSVDRTFIKREV